MISDKTMKRFLLLENIRVKVDKLETEQLFQLDQMLIFHCTPKKVLTAIKLRKLNNKLNWYFYLSIIKFLINKNENNLHR
jgi:hypothetical protein